LGAAGGYAGQEAGLVRGDKMQNAKKKLFFVTKFATLFKIELTCIIGSSNIINHNGIVFNVGGNLV
jgi:hypothetical protein